MNRYTDTEMKIVDLDNHAALLQLLAPHADGVAMAEELPGVLFVAYDLTERVRRLYESTGLDFSRNPTVAVLSYEKTVAVIGSAPSVRRWLLAPARPNQVKVFAMVGEVSQLFMLDESAGERVITIAPSPLDEVN